MSIFFLRIFVAGRLAAIVGSTVLWLIANRAAAQESPPKLAATARLDLLADPTVGPLQQPQLKQAAGEVDRMNWLKSEDQPRSLTVDFAISPLAWRPFELRFIPTHSGSVSLILRGPWEKHSSGKLWKQEIAWDSLQCDGATLANGDFDASASNRIPGWQAKSEVLARASTELPAHSGSSFLRTWHDVTATAQLSVTGGQPVVLRGFARSIRPAGFKDMPRVTRRDTPAHLALQRFRRGVNFGNYLEVPPDQTWSIRHTVADVQHAAREGFDHVRLPVGWHHYTGPAPEYRLKPQILRTVDELVAEAKRQRISLLVNIHHFDEFTTDPASERPRFIAIWKQLAEHYAAEPDFLAFELLNEPKDAATTEVLNPIYAEAIQTIRQSNPTRTLFVGPGKWNSPDELAELRLPVDDLNLITTLHCYSPMYFTHQGASWTGDDFRATGIQFPGPPATPYQLRLGFKPYVVDWIERYNRLPTAENPSSPLAWEGDVQRAVEWSEHYGRPIHFGEFGAYTKADAESRVHYYRGLRTRLEQSGVGWAIWDWKAGFRYWNARTEQPEPGLRAALFDAKP